jgi:hypothetical protein
MNTFVKIPASKMSLSKRKTVHGFGINDADYIVRPRIGGVLTQCKTYSTWADMIERCYSKKFHSKNKTYIDCTVCSDWLIFSNFAKWHEENYVEGWHLDKDLKIKGNKQYSPDSCVFVPQSINNILVFCDSLRGDWPVGVSFSKYHNKFKAEVRMMDKKKFLGYFDNPISASNCYIKAKNKEIMRKCEQYPQFAKYLTNHLL